MHFRTGWMLAVVVNFVVGSVIVEFLREPISDFRKYSLGVGCDYIDGEWYCETGVGPGLADLMLRLYAIAGSLAIVLVIAVVLTTTAQRFRLARDLRLVAAIVLAITLPLSLMSIGRWSAGEFSTLPVVLVHTGIAITLFSSLKQASRTRLLIMVGASIAAAAYLGSANFFAGFAIPGVLAFLIASAVATLVAAPRRADEPSTGLVAILATAGP